jgi:hypothetical protein
MRLLLHHIFRLQVGMEMIPDDKKGLKFVCQQKCHFSLRGGTKSR